MDIYTPAYEYIYLYIFGGKYIYIYFFEVCHLYSLVKGFWQQGNNIPYMYVVDDYPILEI